MSLNNFFRSLFILFIVGLLATILFPFIDKTLNPASTYPGIITFMGVGVTLTLVTAIVLYVGLRSTVSLQKQFFVYALVYNTLIIVAKFVFAPWSLYDANQTQYFSAGAFSLWGNGSGDPLMLILTAGVIFLIYFVFLLLLYFLNKGKVTKALHSSDKTRKLTIKNLSKIAFVTISIFFLIGILIFISGGVLLVYLLIPIGSALNYLTYLASSIGGILIAWSLIGAILFISAALHDVAKQAILLRNAALLTSFFWIAVSFLLLFHALWVVYLLILLNLWPLKVVVPK